MNKGVTALLIMLPILGLAEEKHHEDPTKIVTKLGVGYNDDFTISGSIGLDKTRMINGSINDDASEWRLGGSWLFDIGILNFSFKRSEYDDGASKQSYNVGTFVPLSVFGYSPAGWQIFPMAGYSYNEGEILAEPENDSADLDLDFGDYVLTPTSSHGAYLGAFALKPLTEQFSIITVIGGMKGSDSYSGFWAGGGVSYKINQQQSFNFFGFISDDNYGKREKISFSYSYQFN